MDLEWIVGQANLAHHTIILNCTAGVHWAPFTLCGKTDGRGPMNDLLNVHIDVVIVVNKILCWCLFLKGGRCNGLGYILAIIVFSFAYNTGAFEYFILSYHITVCKCYYQKSWFINLSVKFFELEAVYPEAGTNQTRFFLLHDLLL